MPDTNEALLRRPQVERITGLRRSALYDAILKKTFPAPVKIGARASAWPRSSVERWIAEKIEASKTPKQKAIRA